MKSLLARRPSPAMVIALIALFVSLSGVSYGVATGFIDSREIKDNEVRTRDLRNNDVRTRDLRNNEVRGIDIRNSTVQGRDIGLNTVTGEDVNESTLGKVPSAGTADSAGTATTAGSADSVGGVTLQRIAYSGQVGGAFVEIFDRAGLRIEARCESAGTPALFVQAQTTAPDSELRSAFPPAFSNSDSDFNPGENTVIYDSPADGVGRVQYGGGDGHVVTIEAYALNQTGCRFSGVATVG